MKNAIALSLVIGAAVAAVMTFNTSGMADDAGRAQTLVAHNVYFTLTDNSPEAQAHLVAECKKYLVEHSGVVFFGAGTRITDRTGPVNDQEYDVVLEIVFKDRASLDKYSTADSHLKFIAENRANWKQVRVFDGQIDTVPVD